MEFTGEYRIPADRETVWSALNDPDMLKACIPGCEELEKRSHTEFTARVATRIGPVSARFSGKVTLGELDPPNGYRISGEGQGGAAGFAKGGAQVRLVEDGTGTTVLTYVAEAQVGGKLAQIGSRLIAGTAQKLADQFFSCLAAKVAAEGAPAPQAPIVPEEARRPLEPGRPDLIEPLGAAPASGATMEPQPAPTRRLPPAIWVPALILLVLLLVWLFGRGS
jgi:carbon monoxide dehydrogenase subunit G